MTLAVNDRLSSFSGDGSTTAFAFDFPVGDENQLEVVLISSAGVSTTQTLTTHYSVTLNGDGTGTVTFLTAPAATDSVRIAGVTPAEQTASYADNDRFPAAAHEGSMDGQTKGIQELLRDLSRVPKLPYGETASALVAAAARAGFVAGFNATTGALEPTALQISILEDLSALTSTELANIATVAAAIDGGTIADLLDNQVAYVADYTALKALGASQLTGWIIVGSTRGGIFEFVTDTAGNVTTALGEDPGEGVRVALTNGGGTIYARRVTDRDGQVNLSWWGANDAAFTNALGFSNYVVIDTELTLSGTVQVPDVNTVEIGAFVTGAGTLDFETGAELIAPIYQLFDTTLTVEGLPEAYAEWFGDVSTDARTPLIAAMNALASRGTLKLANRSYAWSGAAHTDTKGISIVGANSGLSRIVFQNADDSFIFYDGAARGWRIENIAFATTQAMTAGSIIRIEQGVIGSADCVLRNLNFRNSFNFNTCIDIRDSSQKIFMSEIVATNFVKAIYIENALNIYLDQFIFDAVSVAGSYGIHLVAGAGQGIEVFQASNGIIANCDRALNCIGTSLNRFDGAIHGCSFSSIWFDDSKDGTRACGYIEYLQQSVFTDCYFISGQLYGCWIRNSYGVDFIGCHFDKNNSHGLRIESDNSNINVIGGSAKDNDDAETGSTADGIWVEGGMSGFSIVNVDCRGNTPVYGKPQQYGITINTGCDNFVIKNNDLRDNGTAGMFNNSGYNGSSKIVKDNLGWTLDNYGSSSGNTPDANGNFNIAHGLVAAPTYAKVTISGDTTHVADVQSLDATNIVVRIKDSSGADVTSGTYTILWEARV